MVDNLLVREEPYTDDDMEAEACHECEGSHYECCNDYCYQCGHCGCCYPEEHNFVCAGGCEWCECEDCLADCDCEHCVDEYDCCDDDECCEHCDDDE